jgi:molecular chaperone GrpE
MKEKKEKEFESSGIDKMLWPMNLTLKAVVLNDKGEVLILKRVKKEKTHGGKFDLPGGHLEKGETAEEGVKREVKEETGLNVEVSDVFMINEYPKKDELFDKIKALRFIAFSEDKKIVLNKEEHNEHFWLPIDEAIKKFNPKDGFENEKRETLIKAKKYLEMKNSEEGWHRAMADLENYKKRVAKNNEEFRKYCLEDFVVQLLPVLDNFSAAVEHIPEDQQKEGWVAGIMHIKNQLETVLDENGITKIDSKKGDKIDEKIHEVISGKSKKGRVKNILKAGYEMGDRVIRPVTIEVE